MSYPISTVPADADPHKVRNFLKRKFLAAADPVSGTAEYMMQMLQIPQRAPEPERISLSGGDVIGLTPDQTEQSLDRVARENEYAAQIANEQNSRRDAAIQGFGRTVFRARELEAKKKEDAEKVQRGELIGSPSTGIARVYPNANGGYSTETVMDAQDKPSRLQHLQYDRTDESGKPVRAIRSFDPQTGTLGEEQILGDKPATGGAAGGGVSPTQAAYSIDTLRQQGMTVEQIAQNFPALQPFLAGVTGSTGDPALEKEKRKFLLDYANTHGREKVYEAERTWAQINGLPEPAMPPIDQIAPTLGAKGRKALGVALVAQGYPGADVVSYLNKVGATDNVAWGPDSPSDPGQWGNDRLGGQPLPASPAGPPATAPVPAAAAPLDQNNAAMLDPVTAPVARTLKDGTKVLVQRMPDGSWAEVQPVGGAR